MNCTIQKSAAITTKISTKLNSIIKIFYVVTKVEHEVIILYEFEKL